jgi:hypothetical protein
MNVFDNKNYWRQWLWNSYKSTVSFYKTWTTNSGPAIPKCIFRNPGILSKFQLFNDSLLATYVTGTTFRKDIQRQRLKISILRNDNTTWCYHFLNMYAVSKTHYTRAHYTTNAYILTGWLLKFFALYMGCWFGFVMCYFDPLKTKRICFI